MATITLSLDEVTAVAHVVAARIQKIDYDLGDCNNAEVRQELRADRAVLISALGEIAVGTAS